MLLAYVYFRKLKLGPIIALLGMVLLAWGMSYVYYGSDLQFNTFFDVIFYLLSGIIILQRRFFWVFPITLLAALNRETSGLIPLLFLVSIYFTATEETPQKSAYYMAALVAMLVYTGIFIGLRVLNPSSGIITAQGHGPGLGMLQYNTFRIITWWQLVATLSILPVIALLGYRKWPVHLKIFFWVIVPIWFVVHAFSSVIAETRLVLVPLVMVFIPGALWTVAHPPHKADDILVF